MTSSDKDDDEDLDAMMGSMRSMFRDMPDEEPPMRGLDALMAAARTKAVEMAPPVEKESWLKRALAMLVRPPMLAAATAVVLVGTTVLLTRKGGDAAVETRRTFDDAPPETAAKQAAGGDRFQDREKNAAVKDTGAQLDFGGSATPPPATVRPQPRPRPSVAAPVKKDDEAKPTVPAPDPAEQDTKLEVARPGGGPGEGLATEPTVKAPEAPRPAADAETTGMDRPAVSQRPAVSVDQLVQQAESAAGRNDCAAVKVTAERIRKLDANAYKTRVVSKPAIKNCL